MKSLEWTLIQYDLCPYEKGKFDHRHVFKMLCECEGRDKSDAWGEAKESYRLTANHQKLRESHGTDSLLVPLEGAWLCWHLDFALLTSRTVTE